MIKEHNRSLKKINLILLLAVVVLTAAPFFIHPQGSEFGGADDQGPDLIQKEHPGYQVWFQPVWEPPSGEIESLLFALQAGIGAGIIGYILGYMKARKLYAQEQVGQVTQEKAMPS